MWIFLSKKPPARREPLILIFLLGMLSGHASGGQVVDHALEIAVDPDENHISVRDHITLPAAIADAGPVFTLNSALRLTTAASGVVVETLENRGGSRSEARYRVMIPAGARSFTLQYAGRLSQDETDSSAGAGSAPAYDNGYIGPKGVFLSGASLWYPRFGDQRLSFSIQVTLPRDWTAVSQGNLNSRRVESNHVVSRWREQRPQNDIYLLAGPFVTYDKATPYADARVFLRAPDAALAERYLEATESYLDLYERLLGPYPYALFSLVENFWETGYGMPSFTLLGPRVIRLPFILHSSYPHEILHNWWGNGVYVDYEQGNWSEGLTAYLADHLSQERRGAGADYRRSALQKYLNYVNEARDFPLSEFRARHGEASQAVGYNKSLMFFHMLRRRLGDAVFLAGLRRFYTDHLFKRAGFAELKGALEAESGDDLQPMFEQWVQRVGAPRLKIERMEARETEGRHELRGALVQTQPGPAYELDVPVAVATETSDHAFEKVLAMDTKRIEFNIPIPGRPLSVQVDSRFDVFRRLDPDEIPPALGQLFGDERVTFVLPSSASESLLAAYREMASRWNDDDRILLDTELQELPRDGSIWLLGWQNRFRDELLGQLRKQGVELDRAAVSVDGKSFAPPERSVVLVGRHHGAHGIAWIAGGNPRAVDGLIAKLPHYGKYSYLAFEGKEPNNILKGQWQVLNSPLRVAFDKAPTPMRLRPRHALGAE